MEILHVVQPKKSEANPRRITLLAIAIAAACFGGYPSFASADNGDERRQAESTAIPEVVVYGEKTERSLHETSSSVLVVDKDSLQANNINQANELLQITPNVVDTGYGNNAPTIRGLEGAGPGIGAVAFISGIKPRLSISIDGRSLTYNELAFGPQSMWDMQQAEIYLGPQSYIQGRNAMAGSMVLKSQDPVFRDEGAVKVGAGSRDYLQTALMLNSTLMDDQLAVRITADRQYQESDVEMATYSPAGNAKEIESQAIRAKVLYQPENLPQLSTKLTYAYYDSRAPQGENQSSDAQFARFTAKRPVFETQSNNYIWDIRYQLNDNWLFAANTNVTDFYIQRIVPEGEKNSATLDGREFHIEPTLRYTSDSEALALLFGLRYFDNKQDDFIDGLGTYRDKTQTQSAYLELNYDVTSSLALTALGRYESEDRYRKGGDGAYVMNLDDSYQDFLPKLSLAWQASHQSTYGVSVAKGFSSGGAGVDFFTGTNYAFGEESVWNYEFFTRHRLFDQSVQVTTNLFYNDYSDLQFYDSAKFSITNLDKASSYGAEATVNWLVNRDLSLFTNLGVLKTKTKDASFTNYDSKELARAPAFTGVVGARYWWGDFELNGNLRYVDEYYSTLDNSEEGRVSGYTTANASLAYLFSAGRATLFVDNLFDADDVVLYDTGRTGIDKESPILQTERTIGISLQVDF
ncbi:TonB-dependent receptor [Vibrio cidicii]|uniref:TonB-dependent receptor n=1 Tax=Vibrio cidicii TaxID=1763883 RepID=UPI0018C24816|nr:TonB-dependent receptor [Vibrio cidicii]MBG0757051.1 hypothetical protein [Vibrio cidicii]